MADHTNAQAQGEAPSYLEPGAELWAWEFLAVGETLGIPVGIYDEPPPGFLAPFVVGSPIASTNASRAAEWITHRANAAAQCYSKIPFDHG